jgi:hypothetical protein
VSIEPLHFLVYFPAIALVQEIPPIVRTLVTLAPALARVPILRGLIIALNGVKPINDKQVLEELQAAKDKLKKVRTKLADDNNKYVIKVSEAMKCVEDNVSGKLLAGLGRAIIATLSGKAQDLGTEIIDPINRCMIEKRLRQDTPRKAHKESRIARPARGHGTGRTGRKPQ